LQFDRIVAFLLFAFDHPHSLDLKLGPSMVSRGMHGRTCRPVGLHLNSSFHRSQDGILYEVTVRLNCLSSPLSRIPNGDFGEKEKAKGKGMQGNHARTRRKGERKVVLML
jgi:hypothetical protein